MIQILVFENDEAFGKLIAKSLILHGYEAKHFINQSANILIEVDDNQPDLLLMSTEMSTIDTESICWRIRKRYSKLPIILLFSSLSPNRVETLYKVGADDFLVKPVKIKHLLTRIKLQLIEQKKVKKKYKLGDLLLNEKTHSVTYFDEMIELSTKEFKLLKFLLRHKNNVLSRKMILNRVWGYDTEVETRVVDVYIGYLRRKLNNISKNSMIKTVRGVGYIIKS